MDQQKFEADVRPLYSNKPLYEQWVEAQNIPVIRDFYIEDLREVKLAPWAAKGGDGAILNLVLWRCQRRLSRRDTGRTKPQATTPDV